MHTGLRERLPNTVTACHALIREIQGKDDQKELIAALKKEIEERDEEIESLNRKLSESEERVDELEDEVEGRIDSEDAIDQFLFEVRSPVGQFKFDVLHGPATDRAILRLFDAVRRQP
jgi:chromosome segregation ATPase